MHLTKSPARIECKANVCLHILARNINNQKHRSLGLAELRSVPIEAPESTDALTESTSFDRPILPLAFLFPQALGATARDGWYVLSPPPYAAFDQRLVLLQIPPVSR